MQHSSGKQTFKHLSSWIERTIHGFTKFWGFPDLRNIIYTLNIYHWKLAHTHTLSPSTLLFLFCLLALQMSVYAFTSTFCTLFNTFICHLSPLLPPIEPVLRGYVSEFVCEEIRTGWKSEKFIALKLFPTCTQKMLPISSMCATERW